MRIDIVCSGGSPLGLVPDDIEGRGVGGAELALMTTAEEFTKLGHQVAIFNNPRQPGLHGNVYYCPIGSWDSTRADVLIVFRTPFGPARNFNGKKIFWSCDQFTEGDFSIDVFPFVDKVVTISPYHTKYFVDHYHIDVKKLVDIGIGIRTWEYDQPVEKVPGRVIFCSVPDRGLEQLRRIWPHIVDEHPELSLVITSDYRLWGSVSPMNEAHKRAWYGMNNVQFLGKVSRSELIRQQLQAEWMYYPCTYEELFCISVAECQVAGAIPITSDMGALKTTNMNGIILNGDPRTDLWQSEFVHTACVMLRMRNKIFTPEQVKHFAGVQFGFDSVMKQWTEVLS